MLISNVVSLLFKDLSVISFAQAHVLHLMSPITHPSEESSKRFNSGFTYNLYRLPVRYQMVSPISPYIFCSRKNTMYNWPEFVFDIGVVHTSEYVMMVHQVKGIFCIQKYKINCVTIIVRISNDFFHNKSSMEWRCVSCEPTFIDTLVLFKYGGNSKLTHSLKQFSITGRSVISREFDGSSYDPFLKKNKS